ncbi:MAG TPA: IPTL-CTERM sorting domain-containing protein [Thermoanaerobaculia bacterium]|nr:IPTL-CTERM sorting domain-containing protein [Thermoanaerobaculia bacterium]
MFRKLLCGAAFLGGILFPAWARAAAIALPGGTLTIPGTSTTGTSFTYSGTLTQNDTIAFTQTGNPCLQTAGTGYCTNGAGVLTVAATVGVTPVGGSSSFSGPAGVIPAGTWTYGSLLMTVSGVGTVQVFPTNAGNGLGSSSPPPSLTRFSTTLSALGFPAFSTTNPTISFIVADTFFGDNSGQFVLSQVQPANVPTLGQRGVIGLAVLLGILGLMMLKRLAG